MIRFACPSCGAVFTANDEKGGKTGTCSKCKAQFIIPAAANPTAPPPPPRTPPPAPPQIPVHMPARTAPQPRQPAPVAKVIRSEAPAKRRTADEDDAPPRRSRGTDNDVDAPPRRRPSQSRDEDDDDRPRRRPESRRDDDDDDRPRRRPRRDEDFDDDCDRPKRRKSSYHGLCLAAGIVIVCSGLLIGVLSIIDASNFRNPFAETREFSRANLPPEMKSFLDQAETAFVFFQLFIYASIVAGILHIIGGIGLIIHQTFGRQVSFAACGLSIAMILVFAITLILLNTLTSPGSGNSVSRTSTAGTVFGIILRFAMHLIPVVMGAVTLFRYDVIKKLK